MSTERPYEMMHVAPRLRHEFTGRIPEATSGTDIEKEKNFLTRALAAYAVYKLANCSLEDSASSVVDGGGDGGIDAVYFSFATNILWLIQAKYIDDGRRQPSLGDAGKFKNGIEALIQGKFEAFDQNDKWNALLPQVKVWLKAPALQIKAILVYTGLSLLEDDRVRIFEDMQNRFNNDDDFVSFTPYGLTSIDAWISGFDDGAVDKIELEILHPSWFKEPYETILGRARMEDVVALYKQHDKKLIAANIRRYKGRTEVNDKIRKTAIEEPQHLFYLNNGLTAYCDRIEVAHEDRADAKRKRITAYGLSIVKRECHILAWPWHLWPRHCGGSCFRRAATWGRGRAWNFGRGGRCRRSHRRRGIGNCTRCRRWRSCRSSRRNVTGCSCEHLLSARPSNLRQNRYSGRCCRHRRCRACCRRHGHAGCAWSQRSRDLVPESQF